MTRDYDAIMLSVAAACQPVAAAYERVQSAYALMLGKLKGGKLKIGGEAHEAPVDRSGLSERFAWTDRWAFPVPSFWRSP